MSDKPIDFRNERERTQWMLVYEQAMKDGESPYSSAERADEDMAIRRRVYPPPGELDVPMLLAIAKKALASERARLDALFDHKQREEVDAMLASIDRMRGPQP